MMLNKNKTLALRAALAVTLVLSACSRSVSGSYVAVDPQVTSMLQLTESPDKRLTGTFQMTDIQADGRLRQSSFNVTGVVDGDNITIAMNGGRNLSGNITDTNIDLVLPAQGESAATKFHAVKGDPSTFAAATKCLTEVSAVRLQQQAQDKSRKEAVDQNNLQIAALTTELSRFATYQKALPASIANVRGKYSLAVAQSKRLLDGQRAAWALKTVVGRGEAGVHRNGINVVITQSRIIDLDVRQASDNVDKEVAALKGRIASGEKTCSGAGLTAPQGWRCDLLRNAITEFRSELPVVISNIATARALITSTNVALATIWHDSGDVGSRP